jgi:hypothetical protein
VATRTWSKRPKKSDFDGRLWQLSKVAGERFETSFIGEIRFDLFSGSFSAGTLAARVMDGSTGLLLAGSLSTFRTRSFARINFREPYKLSSSIQTTFNDEPGRQGDGLCRGEEKGKRFASLDALRGLTILLMILVNNPGSWGHVYGPLRHAAWHGCTMTDLVFPFFLFIVGSAMYFSFGKSDFQLSSSVAMRIVKRAVVIFAIGLGLHVLAAYTYATEFRIMGVLQRIALAYAAAALIVLLARSRTVVLVISSVLLLGYWGVLLWMGGDETLFS